jgi:hypothetical protein
MVEGHTFNQTSGITWPHASFASFWEALLQAEQIEINSTLFEKTNYTI